LYERTSLPACQRVGAASVLKLHVSSARTVRKPFIHIVHQHLLETPIFYVGYPQIRR